MNDFWNEVMVRWRRMWRHALGRTIGQKTSGDEGDQGVASRAHFWAEFREGRREAETRADRLRP